MAAARAFGGRGRIHGVTAGRHLAHLVAVRPPPWDARARIGSVRSPGISVTLLHALGSTWGGSQRPHTTSESYGRRAELYDDDVFVPVDEHPNVAKQRFQPSSVYVHSPPPWQQHVSEQAQSGGGQAGCEPGDLPALGRRPSSWPASSAAESLATAVLPSKPVVTAPSDSPTRPGPALELVPNPERLQPSSSAVAEAVPAAAATLDGPRAQAPAEGQLIDTRGARVVGHALQPVSAQASARPLRPLAPQTPNSGTLAVVAPAARTSDPGRQDEDDTALTVVDSGCGVATSGGPVAGAQQAPCNGSENETGRLGPQEPQEHAESGGLRGARMDPQPLNWNPEASLWKDFYQEHPEVAQMTPEECQAVLQQHGAVVEGGDPAPKPLWRLEHAGFPESIKHAMERAGFTAPTPIQAVGWPIALSGRDLIGLAQTGSGKTLAYLLPALVHIAAQAPLRPGEGPVGLVLAPTRELVLQIQAEAFRFGELAGVREAAVYGGVPRRSQMQELRRGAELCIATPGRLLDLLEAGATSLGRVTYLVLDEADRMLDMGFEPQLRRVVSQIRPERQTLMWSATWPREIRHLVRDFCQEQPLKATIGSMESRANPAITQEVHLVTELDKRGRFFDWLKGVSCTAGEQPRILVFTETKRGADALCRELIYEQFPAAAIHGDKEQLERERIMHHFRTGRVSILVATDVAQRGLDVKGIRYVVNYDVPKTIEDYIHRIGRTGRAGEGGHAVTFLGCDHCTPHRVHMARLMSRVIQDAGQEPPDELCRLAAEQ